jgi:hypothetical protein
LKPLSYSLTASENADLVDRAPGDAGVVVDALFTGVFTGFLPFVDFVVFVVFVVFVAFVAFVAFAAPVFSRVLLAADDVAFFAVRVEVAFLPARVLPARADVPADFFVDAFFEVAAFFFTVTFEAALFVVGRAAEDAASLALPLVLLDLADFFTAGLLDFALVRLVAAMSPHKYRPKVSTEPQLIMNTSLKVKAPPIHAPFMPRSCPPSMPPAGQQMRSGHRPRLAARHQAPEYHGTNH